MNRQVVTRQPDVQLRRDDRVAASTRTPPLERSRRVHRRCSRGGSPASGDTAGAVRAYQRRRTWSRLRGAAIQPNGLFELGREGVPVKSIGQPPGLLAPEVPLCRCSESNAAGLQEDLRPLRIASASTKRPAATSTLDSRKAAWSAARSASSSQSPGSRGRRSTSVPLGKSVGSSTTSRPARTRAFEVIEATLAPGGAPNKPFERPGGGAGRSRRTSELAARRQAVRRLVRVAWRH
jgi:hypothetical protein